MANILVIDSDTVTRKMVEQTLRPAGHVVLSATSRTEGLELSRVNPIDVAIICLYMPNEAGMNTVVDFLYESPGVEIVAFASQPGATNLSSFARWLGATKSLTKPVERRELLKAVDEVLLARRDPGNRAFLPARGAARRAKIARHPKFNPMHEHGAHSHN